VSLENVPTLLIAVETLWKIANNYEVPQSTKVFVDAIDWLQQKEYIVISKIPSAVATEEGYRKKVDTKYMLTDGGALLLERFSNINLPKKEVVYAWS